MNESVTNTPLSAPARDYELRCARVEELQRSNRRVALMALLVAVGLMIASAAYITWSGDSGHAPMEQHSSIGLTIGTE